MEILISRDGKELGPYSPREVRDRIASGQLTRTDLAWYEGLADWVPLSEVRLPLEEEKTLVRISRPTPVAAQSYLPVPTRVARADTKNCPFCAEPIKIDAVKCRYCNETLMCACEQSKSNAAPQKSAPAKRRASRSTSVNP